MSLNGIKNGMRTLGVTRKIIVLFLVLSFISPTAYAILDETKPSLSQGIGVSSREVIQHDETTDPFWIEIIGKGEIQNGIEIPYILQYGNNGTRDIPAPLIAVSAISSSSDAYVQIGTGTWRSLNNTLIISSHGPESNPETIPAGMSYSIPIKVIAYNNTQFSLIAVPLTAPSLYTPSVIESVVEGTCPESGVPLTFERSYFSGFSSYNGPLGYGWIHSYDLHLEMMGDGNVALMQGDRYNAIFYNVGDGLYQSPDGKSTLKILSDGTLSLTDKSGGKIEFNKAHVVTYIQDTTGTSVSLEYDSQSRMVKVHHSSGDYFTFTYTNSGKLGEFTDHAGRITRYEYEDARLSSVTGPDGYVTRYHYTPSLGGYALTTVIYPDASRYDITYDSAGRLTEVSVNGGIKKVQYSYDHQTHTVRVSGPDNDSERITLTSLGQVSEIQGASGRATQYTYNQEGQISAITNKRGVVSNLGYDASNHLVSISDTTGQKTTIGYTPTSDTIAWIEDPLGRKIQFFYDDRDNLIEIKYPDNHAERFRYNDRNLPEEYYDSAGNVQKYFWNSRGQVTSIQDALGYSTDISYDREGDPIRITDSRGNSVTYDYDTKGRLLKKTYPDGSTEQYTYDSKGYLDLYLDRIGQITSFGHDSEGNLEKIMSSSGKQVWYRYDGDGSPIAVDIQGADNSSVSYRYRNDKNTEKFTTEIKGLASVESFSITREYNANGNLACLIYPDGYTLKYFYDPNGRLITITDSAQKPVVAYQYNAVGMVVRKTRGNGVSTDYEYDSCNRLIRMTSTGIDGKIISTYIYTYNSDGLVTAEESPLGENRYYYDKDHQIVSADYLDKISTEYQYDEAGNRIRMKTVEGTTEYTTNNLDQYTRAGTTSLTYDRNGNLLSRSDGSGITQYRWGDDNRLTGVIRNKQEISYQYDDVGRLITKTSRNLTIHYIWDGMDLIAESDDAGHIVKRYVYGSTSDELILSSQQGQNDWVLQDNIGSVVTTLDDRGIVTDNSAYDVFGIRSGSPSYHLNQGFAGMYWDNDAGMYYARNRWYDPGLGRFISPDFIESSLKNVYNYAENSPTQYKDTNGLYVQNKNPSTTEERCKTLSLSGVGAISSSSQAYISGYLKNPTDEYRQFIYAFDPDTRQPFYLTEFTNEYKIKRYKVFNRLLDSLDIVLMVHDAWNWGKDLASYRYGEMSRKDFTLKTVDFSLGTTFTFGGLLGGGTWANPASAIYNSGKLGWALGRIIGEANGGYFDKHMERFLQTKYENIDNIVNRYDLQQYKNTVTWAINVGLDPNEIGAGSLEDYQKNAGKISKLQAGWANGLQSTAEPRNSGMLNEIPTTTSSQKSISSHEITTPQDYIGYQNQIAVSDYLNMIDTSPVSGSTADTSVFHINPTNMYAQQDIENSANDIRWDTDSFSNIKNTAPFVDVTATQVKPRMTFYPLPNTPDDHGGGAEVISPGLGSPHLSSGSGNYGGVDFSSIQMNSLSIAGDSDAQIVTYTMKSTQAQTGETVVGISNATHLSIKAFFTALTMPDSTLWVNLDPRESNRIIDKDLAKTDVGRIMLEADFSMKKAYAKYENGCVYPVGDVYEKRISMKKKELLEFLKVKYPEEAETIDKVAFPRIVGHWIGPDHLTASMDNNQMFIENMSLKVIRNPTDIDNRYQISDPNVARGLEFLTEWSMPAPLKDDLNTAYDNYIEYAEEQEDLLITPLVTRDINTAPEFAELRSIYPSIALAQWYKERFRNSTGTFSKIIDTRNVKGLEATTTWDYQKTYDAYVKSYRDGEFWCSYKTTWTEGGVEYPVEYSYGVGGVLFTKISPTSVQEINNGISQIIRSAAFTGIQTGSAADDVTERTGLQQSTEGASTYTGDSIFLVLRSGKPGTALTHNPNIRQENRVSGSYPLKATLQRIPDGISVLPLLGVVVLLGMCILAFIRPRADYEDDNY